jgi:hypothetical protein
MSSPFLYVAYLNVSPDLQRKPDGEFAEAHLRLNKIKTIGLGVPDVQAFAEVDRALAFQPDVPARSPGAIEQLVRRFG